MSTIAAIASGISRLAAALGFGVMTEPLSSSELNSVARWPGPRKDAVVLFLNFDGVLHPNQSETFEYLPELYRILDAFPGTDVVISSDWRHSASHDYLLRLFDAPYRDRIRDITGPERNGRGPRQAEIEAYAAANGIRYWIAVDDDAGLFLPECPWLCHVPRAEGLGHGNVERVIAALGHLSGAAERIGR